MSVRLELPGLNFSKSETLSQLLETMPAGLCGVPDEPHAANVLLLNAEGSGVGKFKEPPVTVFPAKWEEVTKQSIHEAVILTFKFHLAEHTDVKWNAVLWQRRLYVQVPDVGMPEGSKEAFLSLLEFSEEELVCSHIIVCFSKSRPDRTMLARTFMFLGFSVLAPGHPLAPNNSSEDMLCMAYSYE